MSIRINIREPPTEVRELQKHFVRVSLFGLHVCSFYVFCAYTDPCISVVKCFVRTCPHDCCVLEDHVVYSQSLRYCITMQDLAGIKGVAGEVA